MKILFEIVENHCIMLTKIIKMIKCSILPKGHKLPTYWEIAHIHLQSISTNKLAGDVEGTERTQNHVTMQGIA